MDKVGQLTGMVTLFVLVVVAAYGASRWMGSRLGIRAGGRLVRAREWLPVGRDRSLILIEAGGRLLLVGSGSQGIGLVADLGEAAAAEQLARPGILQGEDPQLPVPVAFAPVLAAQVRALRARMAASLTPFARTFATAVSGSEPTDPLSGVAPTTPLDLEPVLRRLRQVADGGAVRTRVASRQEVSRDQDRR